MPLWICRSARPKPSRLTIYPRPPVASLSPDGLENHPLVRIAADVFLQQGSHLRCPLPDSLRLVLCPIQVNGLFHKSSKGIVRPPHYEGWDDRRTRLQRQIDGAGGETGLFTEEWELQPISLKVAVAGQAYDLPSPQGPYNRAQGG